VHRCGAIAPLIPPACRRCGNNFRMALDTRGSERLSNFRWVCRAPPAAQRKHYSQAGATRASGPATIPSFAIWMLRFTAPGAPSMPTAPFC
jgi:hypothetical protein